MALTDGLKGLWHMNNVWTDSSGKENDGVATGAIFESASPILGSHSGKFDGVDDFVSFGTDTNLSAYGKTAMSCSALVKLTALPGAGWNALMWCKRDTANNKGYLFVITETGSIFTRIYHSTTSAQSVSIGSVIAAGTTYNIIITYNDDGTKKLKIYVNNSEVTYASQTAGVGTINDDRTVPLYISKDGYDSSTKYNGLIDEMAIWNRALTSGEISEIYNGGSWLEIPAPTAVGGGVWGSIR